MTTAYPLARRNQPQWLDVAAFLAVARLSFDLASARADKRGAASAARPAPEAQVRSIPDGNHGDNLRSAQK